MLADIGGITVAGVRLLMSAATRAGTRLRNLLAAAGDAVLKTVIRSATPGSSSIPATTGSAVAQEKKRFDNERRGAEQNLGGLQQLVQAMVDGKMYSHQKCQFVWQAEFGHVCQSSVQDAAGGGIGRWLPMSEVGGLAAAWKDGWLFQVTTADVAAWPVPSAPVRAIRNIDDQLDMQSAVASWGPKA